jgi:CRISPR-associated protein Csx17
MAEHRGVAFYDVELAGCRPEPLASYLKALGVLRLVAEQKDKEARGFWLGDVFVLRSSLDRDALARFFADEWRPTPIVSPWNGGSGFWPSTSDEALREIEATSDPRLTAYASTIQAARRAIDALKLIDAPEKGEPKTRLLTYLRANGSEESLAWLDAAAVLTEDEPVYPALLGTGGNDGRQDFSNNFMQRVCMVLKEPRGLSASVFGESSRVGAKGSMGQFMPTALSRSNPWDLIFALEGAMVLAGAATRRLETRAHSTLAFPFHARAATAPSLAEGEDGHGELWLPMWSSPSTFRDVKKVFAEGRAKIGAGSASTGLDFARSVARLGVDRGLSEFLRFSFQPRNGKNYFATAIGRFPTANVRDARLLDDVDAWFDRFRQKTTGKNVPARIGLARRRLEQAMFDAVGGGTLAPVLVELGDAERALAQSLSFTEKAFLSPIPRLQGAWLKAVENGTIEQRLGASLAQRTGMRRRLVPLDASGSRFGRADDAAVVFTNRSLIESLHALLLREEVEQQQRDRVLPFVPGFGVCSLTDIARFIDHEVDDDLVERWMRAFILVDGVLRPSTVHDVLPPATFAVLALVHGRRVGEDQLPRTATILSRACAGDSAGATAPAIRRLNACGRPLPVTALVEPKQRMRRIGAALAFPLTEKQRQVLESMVLPAADDAVVHSFSLESTT